MHSRWPRCPSQRSARMSGFPRNGHWGSHPDASGSRQQQTVQNRRYRVRSRQARHPRACPAPGAVRWPRGEMKKPAGIWENRRAELGELASEYEPAKSIAQFSRKCAASKGRSRGKRRQNWALIVMICPFLHTPRLTESPGSVSSVYVLSSSNVAIRWPLKI